MGTTKTITAWDLAQFTGTQTWYRHGLNRKVLYTQGVQYLAERAAAYWLVDEVALGQRGKVGTQEFQVWKLTVEGHRAVLTVEDGNGNEVMRKKINFTDFPLPEVTLWFTGGVIMLPSEY